jgi:hypothetical protein
MEQELRQCWTKYPQLCFLLIQAIVTDEGTLSRSCGFPNFSNITLCMIFFLGFFSITKKLVKYKGRKVKRWKCELSLFVWLDVSITMYELNIYSQKLCLLSEQCVLQWFVRARLSSQVICEYSLLMGLWCPMFDSHFLFHDTIHWQHP